MKILGHAMRGIALAGNLVVAAGFLLCGYSSYIQPVTHPIWACVGLGFPVFLLLNLFFLFFWLVFRRKFACFPLLVFIAGWGPVRTYMPFNRSQDPQGGTLVKLLTYNIMNANLVRPDNGAEEGNIVTYLEQSEADIICLQEITCSEKQIRKAFPMYPYVKRVGFATANGVACLSKYPILSGKRIEYASAFNGSALFRLKIGNDTVALINNHLESNKLDSGDKALYKELLQSPDEEKVKTSGKYLWRKLAEAVAIRAVQADSVAKVIAGCGYDRMLVCGDFNDSPLSYARRVIAKGLKDAYVEGGNGPGFSYNQNLLYFRIDHILAGTDFRVLHCEVDRSIRTSDHYPVWCLLEKKE